MGSSLWACLVSADRVVLFETQEPQLNNIRLTDGQVGHTDC